MAYAGYLIKVKSSETDSTPYEIPLSFIKSESYQAEHLIQDLDSYRDANGVLHRNALAHVPDKAEFECVPLLTATEMNTVVSAIRAKYSVAAERKLWVTMYVPELNDYVTQEMYMPDPQFTIYYADATNIQYNSVRFAFIGY